MRRPTRRPFRGRLIRVGVNEQGSRPSRYAGVVATACTQGKRAQHGKPHVVVRDGQPNARESRFGRGGVAERPVVPLKLGNSGGGKEPWFKADAGSDKEGEIGATLRHSRSLQASRNAYHVEAKEALELSSGNSPTGDGRRGWLREFCHVRRSRACVLGSVTIVTGSCDLPWAKACCLVREPDAGSLHVRFDEGGVETGLRQGYLGTARRKGRQPLCKTYCYRATSLLYPLNHYDFTSDAPLQAR